MEAIEEQNRVCIGVGSPAWKALEAHYKKVRTAASAQVVRRRSQPRRTPDRRPPSESNWTIPRIASPMKPSSFCSSSQRSRAARAHRRHVFGQQDQHHGEPRRPAYRVARARRRIDHGRRPERGPASPCRPRQDGRLLRTGAERRVEGPYRQAHPQRRQYRHRRLRPRSGHGLRSACATTASAT